MIMTTMTDNHIAPLPDQRKQPVISSSQTSSTASVRARATASTSSTRRAFQLVQCWLLFSVASSLSTLAPPNPRPRSPRSTKTTTLPTGVQKTQPALQEYGVMPAVSPATGLTNHLYDWKHGQSLRYCVAGPVTGQPVILVHGLFCNADHWRKSLKELSQAGCRVYALDLLGCGYSDKPAAGSAVAAAINGEAARFDHVYQYVEPEQQQQHGNVKQIPDVSRQVALGTTNGKGQRIRDVPLRHPDGSPYNMYTWSDCVTDFCRDICLTDHNHHISDTNTPKKALLVGNSKGTVVALQAAMDHPALFSGVFCITPTFRELHAAEIPAWATPVVRCVMRWLRTTGAGPAIFKAAAVPKIVRELLEEPYAVRNQVDDELVEALLDPLLTQGACPVLLDTLSYAAGPVPEQQLSDPNFPLNVPVWIGYGTADPWTPAKRVQALQNRDNFPSVERVQGWNGVGHCPHDEDADAVHSLLMEFLQRLAVRVETTTTTTEQVQAQQQQQQHQQQPVQEQELNRGAALTGTTSTSNANKRPYRPRARPRPRIRTRTPDLVAQYE
jgi:pimeloyl-ACP methyl ester carboxylesterase